MKKITTIFLVIAIVLTISGCTEELSDFDKASECISQFIQNTYETGDPKALATMIIDDKKRLIDDGVDYLTADYERRIKPYTTQDAIDEFRDSNLFLGVIYSAARRGFEIDVVDVSLDQYELDDEKIFTDYETTFVLTFEDGISEEIVKKGKMQLIKIDGEWKINHEKSNSNPIVIRAARR